MKTKAPTLKSTLRLTLKLLELRIRDNERNFQEAVAEERWSQVSGLHGIGTGLLMAKRVVEDEFKTASVEGRRPVKKVSTPVKRAAAIAGAKS